MGTIESNGETTEAAEFGGPYILVNFNEYDLYDRSAEETPMVEIICNRQFGIQISRRGGRKDKIMQSLPVKKCGVSIKLLHMI